MIRFAALTCTILALAIRAVGGELNPPPGSVVPTHKTLTEVEPRIPVGPETTPAAADALFKITQPSSCYLAGNVTGESAKHGIEIAADRVRLNQSGFAVTGMAGSLNGIHMPAFGESVVIRNGTVSQWGGHGISARIYNGAGVQPTGGIFAVNCIGQILDVCGAIVTNSNPGANLQH